MVMLVVDLDWREFGSLGRYRPMRRAAMVDLPQPEDPTIAVDVPSGRVSFRLWRTKVLGRAG